VSAVLAALSPCRIKATHRRRRKIASGPIVQRYYDPQIGRMLSVDPEPTDPNSGANFNSYWYANNNPYKFTDPDGRTTSYASDKIKDQVAKDAASSSILSEQLKKAESDTEHNMSFTYATTEEEADPSSTSQMNVINSEISNSHPNSDGSPGSGASVIVVLLQRTESVNIATHTNPKVERQAISSAEKTVHEVTHGLEAMAGVLPDTQKQRESNAMKVETQFRKEQGLQGKRVP
jgi:RHS repeat-associated protein